MAMQTSMRRKVTRRLFAETLESRALMAGDVVHNFVYPHDVDSDGSLTPLDALVVINDINRGAGTQGDERPGHDVDDDSMVTPLDALIVVNALNAQNAVGTARPQSAVVTNPASSVRVRVELETVGIERELDIRVENAPASKSFNVTLNDLAIGQLTTDNRGRGRLVLSNGDDNRNHMPLPAELTALSPEMELVIGDIVQGNLSRVSRVEDSGATTNPAVGSGEGPTTGAGVSAAQRLDLIARFDVVAGVRRSAEYEQQTEKGLVKRKFKAEIEGAARNTAFDVKVNDVLVGKLVTDAKGKAKLILSTQPKDARESLMPAGFPAVSVGSSVTIGTASSTFQRIIV
jgi:hypothetical protein